MSNYLKSHNKGNTADRYAARRFGLLLLDRRHSDLRWMHDQLGLVEAELIALARGSRERLEIRRRAAELFLHTCLMENAAWTVSRAALATLESLGYTNIDRRVHFAITLGHYRPATCPPSLVIDRPTRSGSPKQVTTSVLTISTSTFTPDTRAYQIYQTNPDPQPEDLKETEVLREC